MTLCPMCFPAHFVYFCFGFPPISCASFLLLLWREKSTFSLSFPPKRLSRLLFPPILVTFPPISAFLSLPICFTFPSFPSLSRQINPLSQLRAGPLPSPPTLPFSPLARTAATSTSGTSLTAPSGRPLRRAASLHFASRSVLMVHMWRAAARAAPSTCLTWRRRSSCTGSNVRGNEMKLNREKRK